MEAIRNRGRFWLWSIYFKAGSRSRSYEFRDSGVDMIVKLDRVLLTWEISFQSLYGRCRRQWMTCG